MPVYSVTVRTLRQWSEVVEVEADDPETAADKAASIVGERTDFDAALTVESADETWMDDIDPECDVQEVDDDEEIGEERAAEIEGDSLLIAVDEQGNTQAASDA